MPEPTPEQIEEAIIILLRTAGFDDGDHDLDGMAAFIRDVLAAHDARIAELEGMIDDIDSYIPNLYEIDELGEPIEDRPIPLVERAEAAAARIAELEARCEQEYERGRADGARLKTVRTETRPIPEFDPDD